MGIFPAIAKLIEAENQYRPINGDVLLIGRQRMEGMDTTDYEFFRQFPIRSIKALDVSDYEGAEIIHDLNEPLPRQLYGIADFIFDGSCLDNIFDPANALRSFSQMLRPDGRMVLMEHSTSMHSALIMMSPEWFFSFFARNHYVDCQQVLFCFPGGMMQAHEWVGMPWSCYMDGKPTVTTVSDVLPNMTHHVTVTLAEKGQWSTDTRSPVQALYRVLHATEGDEYLEAHKRYSTSRRVLWMSG